MQYDGKDASKCRAKRGARSLRGVALNAGKFSSACFMLISVKTVDKICED